MSDEAWRGNEIESPCVKLCMIHPSARICVGCHRTLDEIANWASLSTDERREITASLPSRKGKLRDKAIRPSKLKAKRRESQG